MADQHLDFVHVVEVRGRDDGTYVFQRLADAQRFEKAVGNCWRTVQPVNVGDAAERLIAAERGDVLEDMEYPGAGEQVREGIPLDRILSQYANAGNVENLRALLQGWAEEDAKDGES